MNCESLSEVRGATCSPLAARMTVYELTLVVCSLRGSAPKSSTAVRGFCSIGSEVRLVALDREYLRKVLRFSPLRPAMNRSGCEGSNKHRPCQLSDYGSLRYLSSSVVLLSREMSAFPSGCNFFSSVHSTSREAGRHPRHEKARGCSLWSYYLLQPCDQT